MTTLQTRLAQADKPTKGLEMTTDNPDPLEEDIARTLSCHLWATIVADNNDDCDEFDAMPDYIKDIYRRAAAAIIAQHYAPVIAENERLRSMFDGPLTDDLQFILGRPCFTFIRHAQLWRAAGHKMPHRAEDEQAFFIGRMLHHYFTNPSDWHDSWAEEIEATQEEARQALGAKP